MPTAAPIVTGGKPKSREGRSQSVHQRIGLDHRAVLHPVVGEVRIVVVVEVDREALVHRESQLALARLNFRAVVVDPDIDMAGIAVAVAVSAADREVEIQVVFVCGLRAVVLGIGVRERMLKRQMQLELKFAEIGALAVQRQGEDRGAARHRHALVGDDAAGAHRHIDVDVAAVRRLQRTEGEVAVAVDGGDGRPSRVGDVQAVDRERAETVGAEVEEDLAVNRLATGIVAWAATDAALQRVLVDLADAIDDRAAVAVEAPEHLHELRTVVVERDRAADVDGLARASRRPHPSRWR